MLNFLNYTMGFYIYLSLKMAENADDKDDVNNTCSINHSKKPLTTTKKMLRAVIGFSVILMCAQGVSSALASSDSGIIKINNIDDLSMIGKYASHPTDLQTRWSL